MAREVICPATGEPCVDKTRGELGIFEDCGGARSVEAMGREITLCGRYALKWADGASPRESKIFENVRKTLRGQINNG